MSWSIHVKLAKERGRLLDQAVLGFGLDERGLTRLIRIEKLIERYEKRKK